jgi:outer membrane protein TolC
MKLGHAGLAIVAASAAGLLAGCLSAPTPSEFSAPWVPPAGVEESDRTWEELRAKAPDLSQPLSLAELTDIALQNNPVSRRAWNDARAAAAQVERAQGYFMPSITATAQGVRQHTSASPDEFDKDNFRYGPGLVLNYLVINFGGGRKAAVEQALQTVYALDYAFNRSLQDILLAVERAYYFRISSQAGVLAAESNAQDAKSTLEAAQARKDAGMGTELDVLQAQARYDQSLYNLAGAQGQFTVAGGTLALVLGLPADVPVAVAEPATNAPVAFPVEDMRKLIDEALQRRPDLASLRASVAAREAAITVAAAALWPSLYLSGSVNRDYYETMSGDAAQDDDWALSGGVNLQWLLFDGFQTRGAQRAAIAQAESERARLEQAELAAAAEVWTRYYNYETAIRKGTFSEAYARSAASAYQLALDGYKAGLKSILDLLTSASQLANARSQRVASRQEIFSALADLAHATGTLEQGGAAGTMFPTTAQKEPTL